MSTIRPIDLATDLITLRKWWEGHGALAVPEYLLPQGFMVTAGGVDIAAAFLYLDVGGKIAVTEYLTTNPSISFSRYLVDDVRKLLAHIEGVALAGAVAAGRSSIMILSFVKPASGEERLMARLGYQSDGGGPHNIFLKPLTAEGGKCP